MDPLSTIKPIEPEGIWLFHAPSYQALISKDELSTLVQNDINHQLLEHWLCKGCQAGLSPTPRFDTAYYLMSNPDVAATGLPAWMHWCEYGAEEGRLPHPVFPGELLKDYSGPDALRAWIKQIGDAPPTFDWLEPLWRVAYSHEPELGRLHWQGSRLSDRPFQGTKRGIHTTRIRKLMPRINFLALLPCMAMGGAERLASIALSYRAKNCGTEDLLILCTDLDDRQAKHWFDGLGTVYWVNDDLNLALDQNDCSLLVAQIVCGWGPKAVMNFNSRAGWEAMAKWGRQMSSRSDTYSWLFSRIYGSEGEPSGYADEYGRQAIPSLKAVLFDNQTFANELTEDYALPISQAKKFKTLYQPVDELPAREFSGTAVLWAGRLAAQKRPDLLVAVARLLPELYFEVWTPQVFSKEAPKWDLDLTNIVDCGSYLNVTDLPLERYALAFFTSAYEGMPNLLLELAASAMPVVASAVGGVNELIQLKTGWAVDTNQGTLEEQANHMATAISQVLADPEEARLRGLALQQLVRERHNPNTYWQMAQQYSGFFRG